AVSATAAAYSGTRITASRNRRLSRGPVSGASASFRRRRVSMLSWLRPNSPFLSGEQRIFHSRFGKSFGAQNARIARLTRLSSGKRIVAGIRQRIIDAELEPEANDVGLIELLERRVDENLFAGLGAELRREICQPGIGLDKFRPAVRIAARV